MIRRLKNVEAVRQHRLRRSTGETEEENAIRRLREAERNRRRRNEETEEETTIRRAQVAESMRRRRNERTEEENAIRRSHNAERMRRRRSKETEEETIIRRSQVAERSRRRRNEETEEETAMRRLREAKRKRRLKTEGSEEETAIRRSRNREGQLVLCHTMPETVYTANIMNYPNITEGTINVEPIMLVKIKQEPEVSFSDVIPNLDINPVNNAMNNVCNNRLIHDQSQNGKQHQLANTNNLITCTCSNRLIQMENNQNRMEKKLDELLDLVRNISKQLATDK